MSDARRIDRIGWVLAILAVVLRIVFWRHTGRVWEDSLITAIAWLAALVAILPLTFRGERNIQRLVEEPVRIAIGKYLHDHSPPDATAGGEPLGYIGYYSRRAYYDYPGLTSRRVVDFIRGTQLRGLAPRIEVPAADRAKLLHPERNIDLAFTLHPKTSAP